MACMPASVPRSPELESAIDSIVASYDGPEEINNLESAALPNRRAVVEAIDHLKPIIYLGFYSVRSVDRANLRNCIGEHLHPARELLVEQIRRAQLYEERVGRTEPRPENWASDVVLRLLQRLPEMRRQLNADVVAAYQGDPAADSIEEIVFSYPSVQAITAHRIAHQLQLEGVPILPRIIAYDAHQRTGVDIHPGATIEQGFFMDHGTGIVIGETAVIGRGVKLYQGVTLGALSTRRTEGEGPVPKKRHPTLEDGVTIYSGATILGGETVIGRGSVIGGNVWLVHSVPPNSKIFGRPRDPE
jgi:serine O-acetyltransferase